MSTHSKNYRHYGTTKSDKDKAIKPVHSTMATNLPYQMDHSIRTLAKIFAKTGKLFILDLRTNLPIKFAAHADWNEWALYANGYKVVSGTKDYAYECFHTAPDKFLELCHKAVEESNIPPYTEREYVFAQGIENTRKYKTDTLDIGAYHRVSHTEDDLLAYLPN